MSGWFQRGECAGANAISHAPRPSPDSFNPQVTEPQHGMNTLMCEPRTLVKAVLGPTRPFEGTAGTQDAAAVGTGFAW